ncbi:MAG: CADD family putative folate metabolism protein [Bradymonadales bacterium]|nr:MAG: CADD family putative folate metabolism protein [Bradymonadales bacterium]
MENKCFSKNLVETLKKFHVLQHPFYQAWNEGKLPMNALQLYAKQYSHHVDAFPRYVSAAHSSCTDFKARQILLENLIDEERGEDNHPELWKRFAEGLGVKREEIANEKLLPRTRELIDGFFKNCRKSAPEAIAALFAYEHQIPEVAETKIRGLKEHYDITDSRSLEFFELHQKADEYHTEAISEILDSFSQADQERAEKASLEMAEKIWNFLSGICEASDIPCPRAA